MKDLVAEQIMEEMGVGWEYRHNVPLNQFDEAASLKNQARLGQPINTEVLEKMTRDAKRGAEFPAIVAVETPTGLKILGGNHREQARKRARRKDIDCYVIKITDTNVIETLTKRLNINNGLPQTEEENIIHAVYLVNKMGMSHRDAARQMGLPEGKVKYHARLQNSRNRLERLGYSGKMLHNHELDILASIALDPVFFNLATLCRDGNIDPADLKLVVTQILEASTETEMMTIVERTRDTYRDTIARTRSGMGKAERNRIQIFRMLIGLENLLKRNPTAATLGLTTQEDIQKLRAAWPQVREGIERTITGATSKPVAA